VKLGILPAVISPFVIAKIGQSAARALFLTGARFSALRAREIGLVHTVVPAAELDAAVAAHIGEVLTASPEAIAASKRLIAEVAGRPPEEVSELTARTIAAHRVSRHGQEGLHAFLEKRRASWAPADD
jgi:methylglutaconyl-CoA hydratase